MRFEGQMPEQYHTLAMRYLQNGSHLMAPGHSSSIFKEDATPAELIQEGYIHESSFTGY